MIEIDSGYVRGLGIVCPKTPLHIREMTEIEKTKQEIKVLTAKLELLKEMEKHKSPAKEAYYNVYGCYPPTTPSVSNTEDERWSAFQQGYNASKEDCKVEEPKPTPETLYDIVRHLLGCSIDCCDEICDEIVDVVEEWLPNELEYDGEEYHLGWNDAIRTTKDKLR